LPQITRICANSFFEKSVIIGEIRGKGFVRNKFFAADYANLREWLWKKSALIGETPHSRKSIGTMWRAVQVIAASGL